MCTQVIKIKNKKSNKVRTFNLYIICLAASYLNRLQEKKKITIKTVHAELNICFSDHVPEMKVETLNSNTE